jgi:hypothetical protein
MATSNFGTVNTSRYFAFGSNKYITQEDIDANDLPQERLGDFDQDFTEMEREDTINCVVVELMEHGWQDCTTGRCCDGETIADKEVTLNVGGCTIELCIEACICSGYYDGACFDLKGNIKVYDGEGEESYEGWMFYDGYDFDESDVIEFNWTGRAGLSKLQAKNIIKRLRAKIEELRREAELAFSRNCEEEYIYIGHFDNGEALGEYCKARLCEEVA